MLSFLHLEDIIHYAPLLFQGFLTTIILSIAVMTSAMVLGFGCSALRVSKFFVFNPVIGGFVNFIRSIPCIMLIALIHFWILPVLGLHNSFFLSAYVGLTLYTTAYLAEIFRGGFAAIHQEESETAISLGLSSRQRLLYVLFPLVLVRMMPAVINQFVTLIKDTSLASIIGVIELTRASEIIYERTLHDVTLLAFVAFIYFIVCFSLSQVGSTVSSKLNAQAA